MWPVRGGYRIGPRLPPGAVLGGIAVIAVYTYLIATPRNDDERIEDR